MTSRPIADKSPEIEAPQGIKPSEFMRQLRPEYYSDSVKGAAVSLKADHFEYHLSTITARNQTHDFELFCRKLCERAICPDLRAQTGPEGGGDSKADTESLPVAEAKSDRYYVGLRKEANETWAFAVSAQKTWKAKAQKDVEGIVATGRKYSRIFFITNQHARAKERAKLEDDLTKAHGVPVTIHDRTWIVDETIAKERTDLAYNFLKVGELVENAKTGPTDNSRQQQLDEIEREIANPENFAGMEMQLVSECLAAAQLSRGLERPRHETDGRFERAIRLAEKHGTSRQKLEARYERLWTAFWWYDDFDLLLADYTAFEESALQSDNALDLQWLGNLHQLLVNALIHKHAAAGHADVAARADRLETALTILAENPTRPNNALEARAEILRIRLNRVLLSGDREQLSQIWEGFGSVVDAAKGLGEFNFDTLARFVDVAGQAAGNDPAYNALIEKCATAVGERKSQGEAALMFLSRAKKLSFDDNFDMIRWLSKAVVGLSKQEYTGDLVHAAYLLAIAYKSAGLLWAARASGNMALATLVVEADRTGDVPIEIVPAAKMLVWLSLELWHLPDALHSIQLLNGVASSQPLSDDSKVRVAQDLFEIDLALGSLLVNLEPEDLARLEKTPDVLRALELNMASTALLYALGYLDTLRVEKAIPDNETDESFAALMSKLKSQRVAEDVTARLILNEGEKQSLSSAILGMRVAVDFEGAALVPVAETILGVLEAFFATSIKEITPHVEEYHIDLRVTDALIPEVTTDPLEMKTTVAWPRGLEVGNYERGDQVRNGLVALAGHVLGVACASRDMDTLLERMFRDEAVPQRIEIVIAAVNSYSRVNRQPFARLSDWDKHDPRAFEIRDARPEIEVTADSDAAPAEEAQPMPRVMPRNHKRLGVKSVIDIPTWNEARWRGCAYVQMGEDLPSFMAFMFENAEAGRKIFERWRERFGATDANDEIALSIIRNLPDQNPHHYLVQITSNVSAKSMDPTKVFTMASRSHEMTPVNSVNLDRFLRWYARFGVYAIIPASMPTPAGGMPELHFDLAIEKRALTVKDAKDVADGDVEAIALLTRGRRAAG